jgi:hypothetical protein
VRLLVPNSRNAQAYALIRSLRSRAERIVALAERRWPGESWLAHGAFAREVDRRIATTWPMDAWERGPRGAANAPAEGRYLAEVERVCEEERIDWAFPSVEGTIYVFARNCARLLRRGVSLVCPPLEVVERVNDKLDCMRHLAEAGVVVPRSLALSADSLREAAAELGFPLVVKPRRASASRGVHVIRDLDGLRWAHGALEKRYGDPMVQEYIPGPLDGGFLRVIGVADSTGTVLGLHVARTLLTLFPDAVLPPAVARSERHEGVAAVTAGAVKALGITGPFLLQFKVDSRDGRPKLLEANCKLSYRVWTAMADGIDVPRLALDVAARREVRAVEPARVGTVFVNQIELLLARLLHPGRAKTVAAIVREGPRVIDPYVAHFARHPTVSARWWAIFLGFALKERLIRRLRKAGPRGQR